MNIDRLKVILKGYGEYLIKYRMFIWRFILRLLENYIVYVVFVDKGIYLVYSKIYEDYFVKSRKLLRIL